MGKKKKAMPVNLLIGGAGAGGSSKKKNKVKKAVAHNSTSNSNNGGLGGQQQPLQQQASAAATATATASFSILDKAVHQVDTDPLSLIIAPQEKEAFLSSHWEQSPCVIKATPERLAFFKGLLTLDHLLQKLKRRKNEGKEPLQFTADINAARYVNGVRETLVEEVADASTLERMHQTEGCTLQVIQPQRWEDKCWRLVSALEAEFGCLVGLNAYLTPKGTQGLAPHTDPVEILVVQTGGRKTWKIYEPLNGFHLPNQASGDLSQEQMGKPLLELTLDVGDVLYMPRGTIHQAVAQKETDSSHITISTYAHFSYGDLASHMLQVVGNNMTKLPSLPLTMRKSPPLGFLFQHSLLSTLLQQQQHQHQASSNNGKNSDSNGGASISSQHAPLSKATAIVSAPSSSPSSYLTPINGLAQALRHLADEIETQSPTLVSLGAYSMALDFLASRIPPHPAQLPPKGPMPDLNDSLRCRLRKSCYLLPYTVRKVSFEGIDEDEEKDKGAIKLVHNLENVRELHMMADEEGEEEVEEEEIDDVDEMEEEEEEEGGRKEKRGIEEVEEGKEGGGKKFRREEELEGGEEEGEEEEEGKEEEGNGEADGGQPPHVLDTLSGIILPSKFGPAVARLLGGNDSSKGIKIRDLPLAKDGDKLELAMALWTEGLVCTIVGKKKKTKKGQIAR